MFGGGNWGGTGGNSGPAIQFSVFVELCEEFCGVLVIHLLETSLG